MIEDARSEYEMAALMQEAVGCPPNGFSVLDENVPPIMASQVSRTAFRTVIALAAAAMGDDRKRYLAEGMDVYVSKPIEQRDLLAGIARRIARATVRGKKTGAVPPFAFPAAAHGSRENLNTLFSTMDVPRKAAARTR